MTIDECAKLLAKVQLVDNREVTRLVILEWFDLIGDLDFAAAVDAVREHRRSSTEYLQPAHIVAIAAVPESRYESIDAELLERSKREVLAAHGTTPEEYDSDESVRRRVDSSIARKDIRP